MSDSFHEQAILDLIHSRDYPLTVHSLINLAPPSVFKNHDYEDLKKSIQTLLRQKKIMAVDAWNWDKRFFDFEHNIGYCPIDFIDSRTWTEKVLLPFLYLQKRKFSERVDYYIRKIFKIHWTFDGCGCTKCIKPSYTSNWLGAKMINVGRFRLFFGEFK